jgi:thiamine-monophosphate kinase
MRSMSQHFESLAKKQSFLGDEGMAECVSVSDVGELGLLERLKRFYPRRDAAVIVGYGDDAAVVAGDWGLGTARSRMNLIATTDMLVEGTHFILKGVRDWGFGVGEAKYENIGRKALAINVSDIAAMGGRPRWFLVAIGVPPRTRIADVEALYRGLCREGKKFGVVLIGGDTVRAERLTINVSVLGEIARRQELPLRSKAKPGQHLYVTGTLGDSGAGLVMLEARGGRREAGKKWQEASGKRQEVWEEYLVRRHLLPTPRLRAGQLLCARFSDLAMIDISDGLWNELLLLARASSVGFEISAERIPMSRALRAFCSLRSEAPLSYALFGGEDYELLFATAAAPDEVSKAIRVGSGAVLRVSCVGRVTTKGYVLRDQKGKQLRLANKTFQHF